MVQGLLTPTGFSMNFLLLWNPMFYCRLHIQPSLDHILHKFNPVHTLTPFIEDHYDEYLHVGLVPQMTFSDHILYVFHTSLMRAT
jgi:hypothetical protein